MKTSEEMSFCSQFRASSLTSWGTPGACLSVPITDGDIHPFGADAHKLLIYESKSVYRCGRERLRGHNVLLNQH